MKSSFERKMLKLANACIDDAIRARRNFRSLVWFALGVVACAGIGMVASLVFGRYGAATFCLIGGVGFSIAARMTWLDGERFYNAFMNQREAILRDIELFR